MQDSNIPLSKWVIAIYLNCAGIKDVNSLRLHRDIGVRQDTARFATCPTLAGRSAA